MTRLHWILVAAGMATGSACAADNCESLRIEIEAKIAASGATRFTVSAVDAQATAAGQVVGACDLGSKKIIYQREGGFPAGYPAATNALWDQSIEEGSYNAGLVYRPTQADSIKLTAARGVQVPTLVDLGAAQLRVTAGPYTIGLIGNPGLQPAIVTNYEIGYERTLPGLDAQAGVSVFSQKTEDIKGQPTSAQIDVMPTVPGVLPLISYRNIGDSEMWGVELTASGKIAGGYHWSGDWTFTDVDNLPVAGFSPTVRGADFSAMTPEVRGNVSFGWSNAQWSADAFAHYTGDHKVYNSDRVPTLVAIDGYVTLGGRVARTFDHGLTLAVSGQNLTEGHQRQTSGLEVERRAFVTLSKAW